jgi:hypothetical protein
MRGRLRIRLLRLKVVGPVDCEGTRSGEMGPRRDHGRRPSILTVMGPEVRGTPWVEIDMVEYGITFFLHRGVKVLISLLLRDADSPLALQNIVSKELRSKILRNKELATQLELTAAPEWLGLGCTIQLCAFYSLGQGCSSHADEFSLFRTVENHPADMAGLGDLASLPSARQRRCDVRGGWCG